MNKYKKAGEAFFRYLDGASIPAAPGNRDYQEYLEYVAGGGLTDDEFTQDEIKATNAKKAEAQQESVINTLLKENLKRDIGIPAIDTAYKTELETYANTLTDHINNPSSDPAYFPPLPPGVTPPPVSAITAHTTKVPGWNNVIGFRVELEISDPSYVPANLALAVYSSADCTGYLYTCGAFQYDSTNNIYYAICPPGQEKGDVAYNFGLLYGAAKLSCWAIGAGEQAATTLIYGSV